MRYEVKGRSALITGASSGIGAALARELAGRGANVVLVARRIARLEALAGEIRGKGVDAVAYQADLGVEGERVALAEAHPEIDILVNNAGVGVFGEFAEREWPLLAAMLELNVAALTHLAHLYARRMTARGNGRIMLVASTASFQPTPMYAAYGASKAYVLSFGEALNVELHRFGVQVTVLCPGTTETEFFDVAAQKKSAFVERAMMAPAEVARVGVEALVAGRSLAVAGLANRALAFSTRFAPRALTARIGYRLLKG